MHLIILFVVGFIMFKIGVLTVVAGMLAISLKTALIVIIVLGCLSLWRWLRRRRI